MNNNNFISMEQAFSMPEKEYLELKKKMDRSIKSIDLDLYLDEMATLDRDINIVQQMEDSEYMIFDNADDEFDYSLGVTSVEAVMDVVVYDEDLDYGEATISKNLAMTNDTRITPLDEECKSMVSTMRSLGLESTKYIAPPLWAPYVRQNRFVSEMGDFVKDGQIAVIEFPNIGHELFSDQFKHNLGIMTKNKEIMSLNTVQHIVYSARPMYDGTEFIVFRVTLGSVITYYLWDNIDIREMESDDGQQIFFGMCSGVKHKNVYYIYYYECNVHDFPYSFQYVEHCYLTRSVSNEDNCIGILLNIDGVDYMVPKEKQVVLRRQGAYMVDKNEIQYVVDQSSMYSTGLYTIINDNFFYCCDTMRPVDSTQIISRMRNRVMDLNKFYSTFPIPHTYELQKECIQQMLIQVEIAYSKIDLVDIINRFRVPFMQRNADGLSKNSRMMASVQYTGYLKLDSYSAYSRYNEFYIGNNLYYSQKNVKPILLVSRRDNIIKIKYYANSCKGKYSRFKLKQVQYLNTGKRIEMIFRERKRRNIMVLSGELKQDFLNLYKAMRERKDKENIPVYFISQ